MDSNNNKNFKRKNVDVIEDDKRKKIKFHSDENNEFYYLFQQQQHQDKQNHEQLLKILEQQHQHLLELQYIQKQQHKEQQEQLLTLQEKQKEQQEQINELLLLDHKKNDTTIFGKIKGIFSPSNYLKSNKLICYDTDTTFHRNQIKIPSIPSRMKIEPNSSFIPEWAEKDNLEIQLQNQEVMNADEIFSCQKPVKLDSIFK